MISYHLVTPHSPLHSYGLIPKCWFTQASARLRRANCLQQSEHRNLPTGIGSGAVLPAEEGCDPHKFVKVRLSPGSIETSHEASEYVGSSAALLAI
jgi:hypothetical protein